MPTLPPGVVGEPMRVRIWPSDRTSGLGASDLSAIAGLSPWRTPLDVWLAKTEGTVDAPTPAQQLGLDLEGFLVHAVEGAKRNSITRSHPDWPVVRLFATPDGQADHGRILVEAKSVTSRYADWADGALPEYYRIQALGQLACYPDARKVLVQALVGGRPEQRTVTRDEAAIDDLVEAAMRWWANYVARGVVPPPLTDGDRWAIARREAADERMTRLATADEEAAARDLLALRTVIEQAESQEQATRLRLAELAAGADIAGSGWKATWSTRVTRDYKSAWTFTNGTAVVPDMFVTEGRVFTVRRMKETE